MLTFPQYDFYKLSDVPCVDCIPSCWEVNSLWTISEERKTRNTGGLPLLSVFLDRGVIPYDEGGGQVHAPSEDLSNYQVVNNGDFVLNNQQAWRGSVGVSKYCGIISPAYIIRELDRKRLLPSFANYIFRTGLMATQFLMASKGVGTIQRQLDRRMLKWVKVITPPIEEQHRIATFLDEKTGEIDDAIAKKQRLIELLQEQKTILINNAVTKGLDPDVPMRESGVEWIGRVPAHWDMKKNKYFLAACRRSENLQTKVISV